jgi:hypothetical protein
MIKQKTAIKLSNKIKQYFSVDTEGYMRANKKASNEIITKCFKNIWSSKTTYLMTLICRLKK